jgi:hypothetical protein
MRPRWDEKNGKIAEYYEKGQLTWLDAGTLEVQRSIDLPWAAIGVAVGSQPNRLFVLGAAKKHELVLRSIDPATLVTIKEIRFQGTAPTLTEDGPIRPLLATADGRRLLVGTCGSGNHTMAAIADSQEGSRIGLNLDDYECPFRKVLVIDPATLEVEHELNLEETIVTHLALSNDSTTLAATGGNTSTLYAFDKNILLKGRRNQVVEGIAKFGESAKDVTVCVVGARMPRTEVAVAGVVYTQSAIEDAYENASLVPQVHQVLTTKLTPWRRTSAFLYCPNSERVIAGFDSGWLAIWDLEE